MFRLLAAEYPVLRGRGDGDVRDALEAWMARLGGLDMDAVYRAANDWIDAGNEFPPTSGILRAAVVGTSTPRDDRALKAAALSAVEWLSSKTGLGSGFTGYEKIPWGERKDRVLIETALGSLGGFYRGWMQGDPVHRARRFADAYVAKAKPEPASVPDLGFVAREILPS